MISLSAKSIITFVIFQILIHVSLEASTENKIIKHESKELEPDKVNGTQKDKIEETLEKDVNGNKTTEKSEWEVKKNANQEQKVEKLEKEKGDLYKQINTAIDESIIMLNKTNNDTVAKNGINFMKELKEQLKEINEKSFRVSGEEPIQRRTFKKTEDGSKYKRKIKLTREEIASLFNKKDVAVEAVDQDKHAIMQARLDEWARERELEKEKIRNYKQERQKKVVIKPELCKRFGLGEKSVGSRKMYYPCCRKCCKKSYMGCL